MNKYIILLLILLFFLYNEDNNQNTVLKISFTCCVIAGIFTGIATFHWLYYSARDFIIFPKRLSVDISNVHPAAL